MRKSICLLCLLLFGGCLAAQADPLVTVTINYVFHNYDDTGSTTFSFDPDQLFFYPESYPNSFYYEGDFLYPLVQSPEFPNGGGFDTVDFFLNSYQSFQPFDELAFTDFGPNFQYVFQIDGICQDIPPVAGTGAVPTFTTMTCNQGSGVYDSLGGGFGDPFLVVNYVTSVDFVVEGGATTPEPSSFILLGTGLAGLFHIGFRRMRAARRAS